MGCFDFFVVVVDLGEVYVRVECVGFDEVGDVEYHCDVGFYV